MRVLCVFEKRLAYSVRNELEKRARCRRRRRVKRMVGRRCGWGTMARDVRTGGSVGDATSHMERVDIIIMISGAAVVVVSAVVEVFCNNVCRRVERTGFLCSKRVFAIMLIKWCDPEICR